MAVRVVSIDTEDGPMHVGQCTLCGWFDPDLDPRHTQEACRAVRRVRRLPADPMGDSSG